MAAWVRSRLNSASRELSLGRLDETFSDEERWITIGRDALGSLLVVVYTWRKESVRLISARFATPREKRQYEESL